MGEGHGKGDRLDGATFQERFEGEKPAEGQVFVDMSDPDNFKKGETVTEIGEGGLTKEQIEQEYGTIDEFVKNSPAQYRSDLGLPRDASSEELFRAMTTGFLNALPKASPESWQRAEAEVNMPRSQMNADTVYKAIIEREREAGKLPSNASLEQIETAMYRRHYSLLGESSLDCELFQ